MRNQRRSTQDLEALSAYLDNALSGEERQALEERLIREPDLRLVLENLRKTRQLVRGLPHVRAPRNFTLTPDMVKVHRKRRSLGLYLRLATSLAAIVLVVLVGFELLVAGQLLPGWRSAAPSSEKTVAIETPTGDPLIFWGQPGMGGGGDAEGMGGSGMEDGPAAVESEPMLMESTEAAPKQPGEDPETVEAEPPMPQTVESEPVRAEPGGAGHPILGLNPEEAGHVIETSESDVSAERVLPAYWRWVQVGLAVVVVAGGLLLIFWKKD
jgi:hypothetical protein